MNEAVKRNVTEKCPYIMLVNKYKLVPDLNMGYYSEFIYGETLMEDGTIIPLYTETEYSEVRRFFNLFNSKMFSTGRDIVTDAMVRADYTEVFNSKRGRGRSYFLILNQIMN